MNEYCLMRRNMRVAVCALVGHRWRLATWSDMATVQWCSRCGRQNDATPAGAGATRKYDTQGKPIG